MSVRVGDEIVAGGQGDMYTKAQVDALIANAIAQTTEKPGMIKPFAGTTVPTGYLLCDGSAVSRTTYADLFAAIGTTYGSGDGSTTFNLPPAYVLPTDLYWGVYSSLSNKLMSFDVGKTSGGAWLVGISTIDRYAYVWSNNTVSGGGGSGNSSGSTWSDSMYANAKQASGSLVKVVIKY